MLKGLVLLAQVGDFVVKASRAYVQTDEGAKELQDIENALAELEQDGSSIGETVVRSATNTLEEARQAVRARRGG